MRPLSSTEKRSTFCRKGAHPELSLSTTLHFVFLLGTCVLTEDLDEAIILGRDVLALSPAEYPNTLQSSANLARCLRSRFVQSRRLQDDEEPFSLYAQLEHVLQLASPGDLPAVEAWIHASNPPSIPPPLRTRHPLDCLFDIWPLCRHYLNISSSHNTSRRH